MYLMLILPAYSTKICLRINIARTAQHGYVVRNDVRICHTASLWSCDIETPNLQQRRVHYLHTSGSSESMIIYLASYYWLYRYKRALWNITLKHICIVHAVKRVYVIVFVDCNPYLNCLNMAEYATYILFTNSAVTQVFECTYEWSNRFWKLIFSNSVYISTLEK
jgi:hypothetical protein